MSKTHTPTPEAPPAPSIPEGMLAYHQDPSLHSSREVEDVVGYLAANGHGIDPGLKGERRKVAKVSQYVGFLADVVRDGTLTGEPESMSRQIEHRIIQEGQFKPSFLDVHKRVAFNHGYGHGVFGPAQERAFKDTMREDQRGTLGEWYKHLTAEGSEYPLWFRRYVADGVIKLSAFDKDRGNFGKRTESTTVSFPDLNAEALANVYDRISAQLARKKAGDAKTTTELNFGKLYASALSELGSTSEDLKRNIDGVWRLFPQSTDMADAIKLSDALRGYGTGWSAAGRATAHDKLKRGDFYLYCTADAKGEYKVPRIAIRMNSPDGQGHNSDRTFVDEIRGINGAQALEPTMLDIAEQKARELPGGERYMVQERDMITLTNIYEKVSKDHHTKLSDAELIALYELDHPVEGFADQAGQDPRPAELREWRGTQDREAIKRLVPEVVRSQMQSAFEAYKQVAVKLEGGLRLGRRPSRMSASAFARRFSAMDKQWQKSGVYDYIVDQFINHGIRYKLVATPNLPMFGPEVPDVIKGVPGAAEGQTDYNTLPSNLPQTVVKSKGLRRVDFGLIADQPQEELTGKTVSEAREALARMQRDHPERKYRVPSMSDTVTYWHALRAKGELFNGKHQSGEKTRVVHFDMPAGTARYGSGPFVPMLSIGARNHPQLSGRHTEYGPADSFNGPATYRLMIG